MCLCVCLTFLKVKGHATDADVVAGRVIEIDKVGTDHDDHFAGVGVDFAEETSLVALAREAHKQAIQWHRWLLVLAASWPGDVQKAEEDDKRTRTVVATENRVANRRRFVLESQAHWPVFH